MAVMRTAFRRVSALDQAYYEEHYPIYPYICHGCGEKIVAGQRFCTLIGASNQDNFWGSCCADVFERSESW